VGWQHEDVETLSLSSGESEGILKWNQTALLPIAVVIALSSPLKIDSHPRTGAVPWSVF
jgi:hypothetical protein